MPFLLVKERIFSPNQKNYIFAPTSEEFHLYQKKKKELS